MKFEGIGYRLGSEPSSELWKVKSQKNPLKLVKSDSRLENTERKLNKLDKKLDLTISKIAMPRRLPPVKFETKSQVKLKTNYINKPVIPRVKQSNKTVKPGVISKNQIKRLGSSQEKTLAVTYESSDSKISNLLKKPCIAPDKSKQENSESGLKDCPDKFKRLPLNLDKPCDRVIQEKTVELTSRFKQIAQKDGQQNHEKRDIISQMIQESVTSKVNYNSISTLKPIKVKKPKSPSIQDYNTQKTEEFVDKSSLESSLGKFWRPSEFEKDTDDPLPMEYLEYSFTLSLPGRKSKLLSLQGDAPISKITNFISNIPELSKSNHSESLNACFFTISNQKTCTDDLGPWNTTLLSDLGALPLDIRVHLGEF